MAGALTLISPPEWTARDDAGGGCEQPRSTGGKAPRQYRADPAVVMALMSPQHLYTAAVTSWGDAKHLTLGYCATGPLLAVDSEEAAVAKSAHGYTNDVFSMVDLSPLLDSTLLVLAEHVISCGGGCGEAAAPRVSSDRRNQPTQHKQPHEHRSSPLPRERLLVDARRRVWFKATKKRGQRAAQKRRMRERRLQRLNEGAEKEPQRLQQVNAQKVPRGELDTSDEDEDEDHGTPKEAFMDVKHDVDEEEIALWESAAEVDQHATARLVLGMAIATLARSAGAPAADSSNGLLVQGGGDYDSGRFGGTDETVITEAGAAWASGARFVRSMIHQCLLHTLAALPDGAATAVHADDNAKSGAALATPLAELAGICEAWPGVLARRPSSFPRVDSHDFVDDKDGTTEFGGALDGDWFPMAVQLLADGVGGVPGSVKKNTIEESTSSSSSPSLLLVRYFFAALGFVEEESSTKPLPPLLPQLCGELGLSARSPEAIASSLCRLAAVAPVRVKTKGGVTFDGDTDKKRSAVVDGNSAAREWCARWWRGSYGSLPLVGGANFPDAQYDGVADPVAGLLPPPSERGLSRATTLTRNFENGEDDEGREEASLELASLEAYLEGAVALRRALAGFEGHVTRL